MAQNEEVQKSAPAPADDERWRRLARLRRLERIMLQSALVPGDEESYLAEQCRLLVDIGGFTRAAAYRDAGEGLERAAAADLLQYAEGDAAEDDRAARRARRRVAIETQTAGDIVRTAFPLAFGPHGGGALVLITKRRFSPLERAILLEAADAIGRGVASLRDLEVRGRQRSASAALRGRFHSLFHHAREAIFQLSLDGRIETANPGFARLLGYPSPEEVTKLRVQDIVEPETAERLLQAPRSKDHAHPNYEVSLRRRDGTHTWVSMNARRREARGTTRVECFAQDTTAARRARQQLRALASLIDAAGAAIISTDLQGNIETWNESAERLYGYGRDESIGKNAAELILPPEEREEAMKDLESVRQGRCVVRTETNRLRKDGNVIQVSCTLNPIRDATGVVVGVACSAHDVEGSKRQADMNLALTRQKLEVDRLQDLAHTRREFINEATHELKTPLTPIMTHLHLLKARKDISEQDRHSLQVIERNATRITSLVSDLADASRLTMHRFPIDPRPMELRRLLRDVIDSFNEPARDRGIDLKVSAPESVLLEADDARLAQVLFNLLSNAIRFTPAEGTISLEAAKEDGQVTIRVTDTGPGLPEKDMAHLFEPFTTFHDRGQSGTGLGLFISQGIVAAHGGTIWAEQRKPGTGLSVVFRLPLRQLRREEPTAGHTPTEAAESELSGTK